jgi:hypothetical protein
MNRPNAAAEPCDDEEVCDNEFFAFVCYTRACQNRPTPLYPVFGLLLSPMCAQSTARVESLTTSVRRGRIRTVRCLIGSTQRIWHFR